jgi:hypothetical protein
MARPLYASDPIGVELDQSLCALDSTTIDVCLSLFPCAKFTDSHSLGRNARWFLVVELSLRAYPIRGLPTMRRCGGAASTLGVRSYSAVCGQT